MSDQDRELMLEALSALASADALILEKLHTQNKARRETIAALQKRLGVIVQVYKT